MEHHLKIMPLYFNAIAAGSKTVEIRKDDRGYKVGDSLLLCEWIMPFDRTERGYTGREMRVIVTDLIRGEPYLKAGYVALSIKIPTLVSVEASKLAALELMARKLSALELIAVQAARVVLSSEPMEGHYTVHGEELDELRRRMRGRGLI